MAKRIKVSGDDFILCEFSLCYGPTVHASGNSVGEVMAEIPEWLGSDENLSFCRVGQWTADADGDDWKPTKIRTIFEIVPYDVAAFLDDEDEDEE